MTRTAATARNTLRNSVFKCPNYAGEGVCDGVMNLEKFLDLRTMMEDNCCEIYQSVEAFLTHGFSNSWSLV